jgi:hypothetical protein
MRSTLEARRPGINRRNRRICSLSSSGCITTSIRRAANSAFDDR